MGNRFKVEVIDVATYRRLLETGYEINLEDTLYLPSIYRNLISLSRLDVAEYSALFSCGKLNLLFNSITVDSVTLYDDLYKVSLNHEFAQFLIACVVVKI